MTDFKVDHLHIICNDLDAMIHFWTKGLGASFKENRVFGGANGAVLLLDSLQINLRVPKKEELQMERGPQPHGYDHLGFRVDDLEAACAHLAPYGCQIQTGPVSLEDRKIAFLKGPEEITLELMQIL